MLSGLLKVGGLTLLESLKLKYIVLRSSGFGLRCLPVDQFGLFVFFKNHA